jgi:hypothetical protein
LWDMVFTVVIGGIIYSCIFSVIIFASSISTNSMRAIIATLTLFASGAGISGLISHIAFGIESTLRLKGYFTSLSAEFHANIFLGEFTILPVLFLIGVFTWLLHDLSFVNYRKAEVNDRHSLRQVAVLLGFVAISTAMILFMQFAGIIV